MSEHPFADRHVGPSTTDLVVMLARIGVADLDDLVSRTVPNVIRDDRLTLPEPLSESAALEALRAHADRNQPLVSLIGLGYHDTITPPVIQRNVLENPAWYTAYTPYQPEISQGRLEVLLNYQTMVADLAGLDIANASMLDEATAAAEAMTMLHRVGRGVGDVFVVDPDCHPQTIAVVRTRAEPIGIAVVVADVESPLPSGSFGVLAQYPGSSGRVRNLTRSIEAAHEAGALVAVATDLLALTMLRPPGEMGADAVVGSSQRFGVPLGFGGPSAGFLAIRDEYRRSLPGRLVGTSVDAGGRPAHRLALQTREQHIRREKATSNICTAQVLLAVMAALYAQYHGPAGLRAIADRVHSQATRLAAHLAAAGHAIDAECFFDTIRVRIGGGADRVVEAALERGVNLWPVDSDTVQIALDETTTEATLVAVAESFGVPGHVGDAMSALPAALVRTTPFCTAEAFNRYHNETAMLRYLRRLADRDLALDRTMIPLGSCTMKLNATTEMIGVTWPEFGRMHPFAPIRQAAGYLALIRELEGYLVEITGYDAVSLQPNAGSQGELAGLLAIRAYHRGQGHAVRDVCLIPSSAHGTNAASAVMAGMRVVVVACDDRGNVDLADLTRQAADVGDRLSAIMVTYPSTHGVFETHIRRICEIVHDHGGQVYLDGANLNAMVGLAKPGRFGADVSHLNLHKTFTIPHGGGGPGVGPVAVRAHLAPYLPNHPLAPEAGPATGVGPISAAPFGSAGVLPIPWVYIRMMGADGLRRATQVAIASANYVAARLRDHFPVLYANDEGLVAHECILDPRSLKETAGVSVDDIAKRLIDYGFHAPTVSFPVTGTLMVEPTESEDLAELDRFCDAMIAIRAEAERVAAGEWPIDDNPLVHAPHTAEDVTADDWARSYPRSLGAFPAESLRGRKYWPPVSRIDAAYGDKNLVCACPSIDAYR